MVVYMIVYIISFAVVIMFSDWFMIWVGMEVNMMSFLTLVYKSEEWMNVESLFKYFFVQSVSSGVFVVMIFIGSGLEFPLMMKMAGGPFFFWLPSVMLGLGWIECFLLMSLQSIIPLVVLSGVVSWWIVWWGMVGMVLGVLGSFGQQLVSMIMAYSSVNHVGWMMVSQVIGEGLWVYYFMLYTVLIFLSVFWFYLNNITSIGGSISLNYLVMIVYILSMGGVPPFLGFVMKWFILDKVMEVSILVSFVMILSSLVLIYVYVRMIYEVLIEGGRVMILGWEKGSNSSLFGMSIVGFLVLPFFLWIFL